jgi:hypothetical protein
VELQALDRGSRLLKEEFELAIMVEVVIEEMDGPG